MKVQMFHIIYIHIYVYVYAAAAAAKSLQSCPTLCNAIEGSPPSSAVPGILQARMLEWVAISFPNARKWSRSVVSDSLRPHGLQPTRLLHRWDFPGKSAGVGCHYLLRICVYMYIYICPHTHVTQTTNRNQCKHYSILNKLVQWMGNLDVGREKKTNFKIEKCLKSKWKRDKGGHWEKRE